MSYVVEPVGFVHASRSVPEDDLWGGERRQNKTASTARHPRNNPAWPMVGIFAQRGKNRQNWIGSTICRVLSVEGKVLCVAELDAIDGTPVLDIKPVMREFLPRETTVQPAWVSELMRDYWARKS
jgi:tRNA (Thr-GGU) A37 N-methylase